jgi:hypothetical protein
VSPTPAEQKPLALLNRSLVVTAALAAMIVAVAFWLGARNKDDDEWVLHSLAVRDQLTQVRILVQAAETGQRGFLITGHDSYLAPYNNAVATLPATLRSATRSPRCARSSRTSSTSYARPSTMPEPGNTTPRSRWSTATPAFF